jgi:hypothetical protein
MTAHQLWLDTLNIAQQQGKPLSPWRSHMEALTVADSAWPFKYVNGTQTSISEALERDKGAHKAFKPDISNIEDALL